MDEINLLVKEARKNVKICERIQKRTEDMQRKRKLVKQQNNICSEKTECGIVSEEHEMIVD